ncbi:MAG TPA: SsrA-binding protein SmpB [Bacteroidia bacterium]|nr:SsrA-binding protein SmpB [Bacteroidia bacterium]HRD39622.1 SsrA-binding protein SmpB [Bacteroidia bacterium]
MSAKINNKVNIENRRAKFDYQFLEKLVAGLVLTGTEIKSIREGKAALVDSYCYFRNNELFIRNMHIAEYSEGTHYNHEPNRERKLLLSKPELNKMQKKLKDQGLTIVPIRLFISDSGYAKLEIALAKGKKEFDKRESIKKRDTEREANRKF